MRIEGSSGLLVNVRQRRAGGFWNCCTFAIALTLHLVVIAVALIQSERKSPPSPSHIPTTIAVEVVNAAEASPKQAAAPTMASAPRSSSPLDGRASVSSPQAATLESAIAAGEVDSAQKKQAQEGGSKDGMNGQSAAASNSAVITDAKSASAAPPAFRTQIQRCWQRIPGLEGSPVTVSLVLNVSGAIEEPPEITISDGSSIANAALDAVRYAIYTCAPYNLPASSFDSWHHITFSLALPGN